MNLGEFLIPLVMWAVAPIILAGILIYMVFFVPEDNVQPRVKTSAQAGKWAGIIIFVMYVISQWNRTVSFSFQPPFYQFVFWPTVISTITGFIMIWIFDILRSTRVIGLIIMALVSATSITLYSYLFIRTYQNDLLFVLLGFMLGVFTYEVFFPEGFPTFWIHAFRKKEAKNSNQDDDH